jgi:hypothetical protein
MTTCGFEHQHRPHDWVLMVIYKPQVCRVQVLAQRRARKGMCEGKC